MCHTKKDVYNRGNINAYENSLHYLCKFSVSLTLV